MKHYTTYGMLFGDELGFDIKHAKGQKYPSEALRRKNRKIIVADTYLLSFGSPAALSLGKDTTV